MKCSWCSCVDIDWLNGEKALIVIIDPLLLIIVNDIIIVATVIN